MAKPRKSKPKSARQAVKSPPMRAPEDVCFVLMPFGGWFDQYFEQVFRPAIEDAGLTAKRADDIYRPGTIVNDIWSFTQEARVLLADLTGRNPNVFYELGLAHALAKPVILVTDSIEQVPFDLRALRVIEYEKNDPAWGDLLKQRISKAIEQVLESPLEAVLPAFLKVEKGTKPGRVTEEEKAILELRRDFDLLRREIRHGVPRGSFMINSADEAAEELRRLSRSGMPVELMIRRLVDRGVPRSWVEAELSARHRDAVVAVQKNAPPEKKPEPSPEIS